MQALQLATHFPGFADRNLFISTTAHTSPGTVALRRVQRLAIASDKHFNNGFYHQEDLPLKGMLIARTLGLLTYRSSTEFNDRFNWNPISSDVPPQEISFEVEKWLDEKAKQFTLHFDPNCYLLLSKCMDLMNLGLGITENIEDVFARIKGKSLVIGVDTDTLMPPKEQERIYLNLKKNHKDAHLEILNSQFGHDAFLHDHAWFGMKIKQFVEH
eukprot:TRINITY_DN1658_c0_g1_i1.p1 TRINITY_DN1658_c0_g1~~TRINITY_DN1658_c0_g1_i1.p1  ORF type:complete len:214 (-),score=29.98 TRINITY_DN1658_c0_g1_i1:594-1235(-)